jgi:hypothetical protein
LDNQNSYCDGTGENRYEGCSATPFGFHWTDTGDASVGAVAQVDIQLETGIDCASSDHNVTLNGTGVGTYPSNNECVCIPVTTPQLLADVDTSTYTKDGLNAVSIATVDCAGLSQDADGSYAVVTVTYADPGPQLAVETGCRTSLKSKLKYKNNATDTKDKLGWKWLKGQATTQAESGDPTDTADYRLCVFRETSGAPTLLFGANVPPSASLWSEIGTSGYKYNDTGATQEGVSKVLLKGGAADKAKIILKGKGMGLSDPTVPLAMGTTGILVQLTNESNSMCWESEFPIGQVTHDAAGIKATDP